MWVGAALLSAMLLGLYDVAKKRSLSGNAVVVVLLLNTLFSTILFSPIILDAEFGFGLFEGTSFASTRGDIGDHALVALKAAITLSSWLCGYYAIKHLPLTIVGPVNATRPVAVLVGALLFFGDMFLSSLSHHNKDLEQRTLKPSARHNSGVLDKPCYSS